LLTNCIETPADIPDSVCVCVYSCLAALFYVLVRLEPISMLECNDCVQINIIILPRRSQAHSLFKICSNTVFKISVGYIITYGNNVSFDAYVAKMQHTHNA
jgi:hypothetical protein